ncbi:hypothetical protein ACGFZQ_36510 [Streptomyces sp. NPDC048254]|jgi:hypothetical protein|uniref:hypothetical protein n=1 Tax=Streptomyces sp. NPDC048254 TaxID=3365525 RepID=UPI003714E464
MVVGRPGYSRFWVRPRADRQLEAGRELQVVGGFVDSYVLGFGNTRHVAQYDPALDIWTALPDAPGTTQFAGQGTACLPYRSAG